MKTNININDLINSFSPQIPFSWVDDNLHLQKIVELKNDELLAKLKELTAQAEPSFHDSWDTTWRFFYMPIERQGQLICSPISINMHRGAYSISFYGFSRGYGYLSIEPGSDDISDYYHKIVTETLRFLPLVKETNNQVIEQTFPYEWRQGRIQRKFIRPASELMPVEKAKQIQEAYKKHLEKKLTVSEISLQDYLNTAAICYHAAFEEEIKRLRKDFNKELTPRDLQRRWADSRHGGMLTIEDPSSKKEYMEWLKSDVWNGAHPFEIVYSTPHGIYLYPPDDEHSFYRISIADPFYNEEYVRMAVALIEHEIPFEAYGLDDALGYITGENYVDVNTMSMDSFRYKNSEEEKKKYFAYIEWDPIQTLKWK